MNPQQLTLTRLLGKKETQHIEGCQAYTDKCGKKNSDGVYICMYCSRWGGNDRYEEVSATPTLSDFHKWLQEKFFNNWEQHPSYFMIDYYVNEKRQIYPRAHFPYNSSLSLLDQKAEVLQQIIDFITSNS